MHLQLYFWLHSGQLCPGQGRWILALRLQHIYGIFEHINFRYLNIICILKAFTRLQIYSYPPGIFSAYFLHTIYYSLLLLSAQYWSSCHSSSVVQSTIRDAEDLGTNPALGKQWSRDYPIDTYASSCKPSLSRSSWLAQMDKRRMHLLSFVRAVLIEL